MAAGTLMPRFWINSWYAVDWADKKRSYCQTQDVSVSFIYLIFRQS